MISQRSIFKNLILIGAIISVAFFPVVSFGATGINKQLPYQGVLKTSGGVKVSDGNYDIIFKIYDAPTGGNILWTGTHTTANGNAVTVTDGVFSVLLGSGSGNTMTIDFSDDTLYLGIKVGVDSEMTPRKRIGASGYAFNTDKLDGIDSLSFVRNDQTNTISASSSSAILTLTQSGTGDILNLFDGAVEVMTVLDGGNVGIGTANPGTNRLQVVGGTAQSNELLILGVPVVDTADRVRFTRNASRTIGIGAQGSDPDLLLGNGNVGIGTAAPSATLHVNGTGWVTGLTVVGDSGTETNNAILGVKTTSRNALANVGDKNNYLLELTQDANNNGHGAGLAFRMSTDSSNVGAAIIHERTGSNSQGKLHFYTKQSATVGVAPIAAMTINESGNVGIGTSSPGSKLEVSGQIKSTAASGGGTVASLYVESIFPALAFYETGVTADNKLWDFFADGEALSLRAVNDANTVASNVLVVNRTGTTVDSIDFDANTLFVDAANNRVGVGTNVPGAQLDVATPDNDQVVKLQRTGTNAGAGYIYSNGNEMFGVNDGTNYPFMIRQTAPGWSLYVNTDGRIGLNTGSPNQGKMEVKGGSVCVDTNSDNNAASCIANESDARLKENVMTIDGALDKILQLRGVSFDWKVNDPEVLKHYPLIARFASSTHSLGLIAQEAQGIVPEAIMQETVGDDEAQYLQLDYDKIVPLLVEGVKEIALLADGFKRQFVIWLADAANGIGDFFAKKIHTDQICLKKSDGNEYCINGNDLEAIMGGREEVIPAQMPADTIQSIEENNTTINTEIIQNQESEPEPTSEPVQISDEPVSDEPAPAILDSMPESLLVITGATITE